MSLNFILYGLECYPLNKADTRSLDFAVTRFLIKMFRSVKMDLINECRFYFDFMLRSELLVKRKSNFLRKFSSCSSSLSFWLCEMCEICVTVIMRPSSLGGGRILRRTLSVRLSVCLSVRPVIVTERHVAPPSELQ